MPKASRSAAPSSVHPRGCGEHGDVAIQPVCVDGSSPRVRGTSQFSLCIRRIVRFIPAGAGNMTRQPFVVHHQPVHPRGCGEHGNESWGIENNVGSSPRVRGTYPRRININHNRRFIPAGAGNILHQSWAAALLAVHPRGCGEHALRVGAGMLPGGSSPRVRGTLQARRPHSEFVRFIPAGAGNMSPDGGVKHGLAVHPRGCGEHLQISVSPNWSSGSSPRVRGTLRHSHDQLPHRRFIPAGAGNITAGDIIIGGASVHPRGCGEHVADVVDNHLYPGSSPRVRGTFAGVVFWHWFPRFIPAGAGNIMVIIVVPQ